jgi:hypothetical protein
MNKIKKLLKLNNLGELTGWGRTGIKNMIKNRETASDRTKESDNYKVNSLRISKTNELLDSIVKIWKR